MTDWTGIFKGSGGEYEVNRFVGGVGVLAYVVSVPAFQAWNMVEGRTFDIVAFCAAYPTGLGVAIGAIAGAVAIKDRNVARAKTETAAAAIVQAGAEGRT
ncbi:MAG: hypothetical protein V4564_04430 [Pseudomonadota bacterium]|uniref:hypothetical protein n=1 Tax=Sphingomonas sp. ERG5 TaxID=1381597 RepID=UPI00054B16A0|nr:hypothetical protein [Sphingomonas sp. ERG5]